MSWRARAWPCWRRRNSRMSAEQFTHEQILSEIRNVWREDLGCGASFDLDSRIDDHLSIERFGQLIGLDESTDFADIINGIEEHFGFSGLEEDWNRYFGLSVRSKEEWEQQYAPHFTF